MAKIPVTAIYLHRAEGLTRELEDRTVYSYDEADKVLRGWARTAPKDGSVHKVDFQVLWTASDRDISETYSGTYELTYGDSAKSNLIGSHIQHYLAFHAGLFCPQHLSRADYEGYLKNFGAEKKAEALNFLQNFET